LVAKKDKNPVIIVIMLNIMTESLHGLFVVVTPNTGAFGITILLGYCNN
jgi:hypothetical protein